MFLRHQRLLREEAEGRVRCLQANTVVGLPREQMEVAAVPNLPFPQKALSEVSSISLMVLVKRCAQKLDAVVRSWMRSELAWTQ